MAFIKFPVKNVQVNQDNRIIKARLGNYMHSKTDGRQINEMPLIMAALSQMVALGQNSSFTYTFPIQL